MNAIRAVPLYAARMRIMEQQREAVPKWKYLTSSTAIFRPGPRVLQKSEHHHLENERGSPRINSL
jgi:hypothetical protein